MFAVLRKPRSDSAPDSAPAGAGTQLLESAVRSIAGRASALGREAAEVCGVIGRYRRIFDDRTGLASARNRRAFLLQTYRRDMGGGQYVVMKEAAAPIEVQGRHWGGLRLAFQF